MLANSLWVIAYDTAYAMVDKPDDLKLGIHTSAIFFGSYDKLITSVLLIMYNSIHAFLAYTYQLNSLFWYIWLGMNLHAIVCIYYLYRPYQSKKLSNEIKQTNQTPKLAQSTTLLSQDLKAIDYFKVFKQAHWLGLLTLFAWIFGCI
jgi:4-hydroxybenzoate polyprenyltransferase